MAGEGAEFDFEGNPNTHARGGGSYKDADGDGKITHAEAVGGDHNPVSSRWLAQASQVDISTAHPFPSCTMHPEPCTSHPAPAVNVAYRTGTPNCGARGSLCHLTASQVGDDEFEDQIDKDEQKKDLGALEAAKMAIKFLE